MSRRRTTPTVDEFVLELRGLSPLVEERFTLFCQHLVAEISDQGLVFPGRWGPGTPIDTSFARRSWRFGIDAPVAGPQVPPKDGSMPPFMDMGNLGQFSSSSMAYLTSDCVYMEPLEYGHSQQAPAGMIRTTLTQLEPMANYVLALLRKGGWQPIS